MRHATPPDVDSISIPTLPEVVMRLSSMIDDPNTGLREIGQTVREDAAMAARLLRIANSASSGLREQVLSVEQAASALGARTVRNLAMQASVMQMFESLPKTPELDIQLTWKHAILTAQTCQALASACNIGLPLAADEYYTCGLIHDLGKLVLFSCLGEGYLDVLRHARVDGRAVHLVEDELLGFNHIDMGARIALRWGLPQVLIDAIQFHHGPILRIRDDPSIAVVALADQMAYRVQSGHEQAILTSIAPKAQELMGVTTPDFVRVARFASDLWPTIEL